MNKEKIIIPLAMFNAFYILFAMSEDFKFESGMTFLVLMMKLWSRS